MARTRDRATSRSIFRLLSSTLMNNRMSTARLFVGLPKVGRYQAELSVVSMRDCKAINQSLHKAHYEHIGGYIHFFDTPSIVQGPPGPLDINLYLSLTDFSYKRPSSNLPNKTTDFSYKRLVCR
jgi:hypothetical protein